MTYYMVHVQPPGDNQTGQLWIANTSKEAAIEAVRRKAPEGSTVALSGGDMSPELADGIDLAEGGVCEFNDDVSKTVRETPVSQST